MEIVKLVIKILLGVPGQVKETVKSELEKRAKERRTTELQRILREGGFSRFGILTSSLVSVEVKSLAEVHEARKKLRAIFGRWEDRKTQIGILYNDNAYCEWESDALKVGIELRCKVKDFPEELQTDKCRIREKKTWEYSCKA